MESESKIFDQDEMAIISVDSRWMPETLLNKKGIFFLKDIITVLPISGRGVVRLAQKINEAGGDAYASMGVRKIWKHWAVRMTVFAPYYRANLIPLVQRVKSEWTGNQLFSQRGLFYLSDVCQKIPFQAHQIRHQIRSKPSPEPNAARTKMRT